MLGIGETIMFDGLRKYALGHEAIVSVNVDYPTLYQLADGQLAVVSQRSFSAAGKVSFESQLYVSPRHDQPWERVPIKTVVRAVGGTVWDFPLALTHQFADGSGICVLGPRPPRIEGETANCAVDLNRFVGGQVARETSAISIPNRMDNSDGVNDIFSVHWDQLLELDGGSLIVPADVRLRGDDALISRDSLEIADAVAAGNGNWACSRVIILRSTDGGRNWQMYGNVGTHTQDEGFNEGTISKTSDGRLVIVMRLGHQSPLHIAWSSDGGRHWTEPKPTPFECGCMPRLAVLADGSLVLLHGIQSIIPPEIARQIGDVRPAMNLGFKYRMGEINLAVSRAGTGEAWDEYGNVLTWPNTTANGGIVAVGPNHVGLVFDMRDYRGEEGQSYFSVVKYVAVDLGKTLWPKQD